MKIKHCKQLWLALAFVPALAFAQNHNSGGFDFNRGTPSSEEGPHLGTTELMLGGSGTSNKHFNDSLGGINVSLGYYVGDMQEVLLRQTANYSNPKNGDRNWNGSSRVAFDQFFVPNSPWQPFLGANIGGVYGDGVRDTWAAGLEGGLKYYVHPRTFVALIAEYDWYFRHSKNFDNGFDTGQWNWSVGVGFAF